MRVAVTGARGFVGRYVLAELAGRDVDVVAAVRGDAPLPTNSLRLRVASMDLSDTGPDVYAKLGSPDVLLHLAWNGLPNYQSPHHVDTELPAQIAFLRDCVDAGLKRLVVTGTCFEYGLAEGELSELATAVPHTSYGLAKDRLHSHIQTWRPPADFELAWLRLFYLYGRGQSEKSLYSLFQAALQRGDESFDMSPGDQIRDFLPVEVAARLIVDIALRPGDAGVVNICSGVPVSVRELVQQWIDASGSTMALNLGQLPYSNIEPMAFWGSRTKLDALRGDP